MTPKIARFLAERQPATPCLVVDIDRVAENFRALRRALPLARIYYAVKANPAPPVLDRLVALGSRFDAAGFEEVEACLRGRRRAGRDQLRQHDQEGVVRSAAPMRRGSRCSPSIPSRSWRSSRAHAPGSRVYCRILVENAGADWPLSRKFGTTIETARELMLRAGELGLDPFGLSFHVGSQQTSTAAYEAAIGRVAMLFTDLKDAGVNVRMVNLGGGFPTRYRDDGAGYRPVRQRHHGRDDRAFRQRAARDGDRAGPLRGGRRRGWSAPRSCWSAAASKDDPVRWVYLDIGRFGGLAETEGEAIKYRITTPHDGGPTGPVAIAGPTCDGADILYEKSNYRLPLALTGGDRVELLSTGAYVSTYASQRFNGFAPLDEHYI